MLLDRQYILDQFVASGIYILLVFIYNYRFFTPLADMDYGEFG